MLKFGSDEADFTRSSHTDRIHLQFDLHLHLLLPWVADVRGYDGFFQEIPWQHVKQADEYSKLYHHRNMTNEKVCLEDSKGFQYIFKLHGFYYPSAALQTFLMMQCILVKIIK